MVVDDDATTLEVTSALLEQRGYEVLKRESALGTTLAILRDQPDVVLLDIQMPGISGDKLVEVAGPKKARASVILLHSARPRPELEALAKRCGAAGAIEKTGDPHEFIKRFEQALVTHRRGVDAARQRRR